MSTTPPSVDQYPAQPSAASYLLTALNIYPAVATQPVGTTADLTKPAKTWTRAAQSGEDLTAFMMFPVWSQQPDGSWVFKPTGLAMTIGDAQAVNVPPVLPGAVTGTLPLIYTSTVPVPRRPLLPNETISPIQPMEAFNGVPTVTRTDVGASAGPSDSSVLAAIKLDTAAIRTKLGI